MITRDIYDKDAIDKEDQVMIMSDELAEMEKEKRIAEQAGRKIIEDNLRIYLKRIGNDSNLSPSFIGWIAHLHPENVKLDSRLDPTKNPYNPHKVIYDHIYNEYLKKPKSWVGRAVNRSRKRIRKTKKRKEKKDNLGYLREKIQRKKTRKHKLKKN